MKTAGEFTVPDVVLEGKYAGTRIADLPTEDLGIVLREHRRLPRFVQGIDIERRPHESRSARINPLRTAPPRSSC